MRVIYDKGIHLPDIELWMDSMRPRDCSVISHAHADHIQSHKRIIATRATARLFEHRVGGADPTVLDFYETKDFGDYKLTFYPAGHCLGSAQTLIEHRGTRLLYTGDFKLRAGLSCEPPEIVPCDVLVTECTFGRPQYNFPEDEEVHRQLYGQIDRAFMSGRQPVVLAYSLGKSQEALKILLKGGYSVALHHSIMQIVDIYREMGVEFEGDYRPLDLRDMHGMVAMMPPGASRGYSVQALDNLYKIYLSGWGMDPSARYRYRTDIVVPLSDHAGFDDLHRYVIDSGAKKVYTVYGDHYFASHLRQAGVDAQHLQEWKGRAKTERGGKGQRVARKAAALPGLFDLIEGEPGISLD
ncbi:MAG TPA: MBL fold metallo-hydrolase [Blastocatellia bacterium]|nr:MBL fold metallo-hydrolase [Blastocatellia bacterium]